jgi:5-formyltetrahydrofolate cyclo-ligase
VDDKRALRRRMKMVRELVDDRLVRSVELWATLAELPAYRAAGTVMAFKSFGGEPDTDALFARLAAEGKRLLLPRVRDRALEVCDGSVPLVRSRFGVDEPQGPALSPDVIEFLIVPGLAFTLRGDRLGYGGGYYDRFLSKVTAPNAGVCFTEQVVDSLPMEPWDVRVQQVVSA